MDFRVLALQLKDAVDAAPTNWPRCAALVDHADNYGVGEPYLDAVLLVMEQAAELCVELDEAAGCSAANRSIDRKRFGCGHAVLSALITHARIALGGIINDWNRAHIAPPVHASPLAASLFTHPAAAAYVQDDNVDPKMRIDAVQALGRLLHLWCMLIHCQDHLRNLTEDCDDRTADNELGRIVTGLAVLTRSDATLLGVFPRWYGAKLEALRSRVAARGRDSLKADLCNHLGVEPSSLVYMDPMRTVVLAAATVLVAAFQVRDDPQSVARAERLTEAIDELASYLDPVARPEASDLTRCEDYLVPPRSHESLPFTLAEVETILRQLALRSWAHGEGRITQPYPHLSNVVWPLPGGRSLAIRVPDMAAMPVLTPGEWESLPRAYHTAPLAAWLTLPSSHRGGGIEGFWSGSAMGHMTEDVADLSSRIAESKFLTALGTASGHAAVAGGGAGTAFYLLHSVWPDAPEPASIILAAAISEMVLSLATRSRD